MILSKEATELLAQFRAWARHRGYEYEAASAIRSVVTNLGTAQLDDPDADGDVAKAIVREVLDWADRYSPLAAQVTREALTELNLAQHIPPTHGEFDVTFGGLTVRLTLPLRRDGSVERLATARVFMDALSDATLTPVVPAESVSEDVIAKPAE